MTDPVIRSSWRDRTNFIVWCFILCLLPVVAHAGGLGMALLTTIIAGTGYLTYWRKPNIWAVPSWFWAVLAFIIWAWITSIWSPYEDTRDLTNPAKTFIGFVLYCGVFISVLAMDSRSIDRMKTVFFIGVGLAVFLLIIDLVSGLALTYQFDPLQDHEEANSKRIQSIMNLGHSAAIIALGLPLIFWIGTERSKIWRIGAVLIGILLLLASILGRFNVGILAVPAISLLWWLSSRYPLTTVKILFMVMIGFILMAPILGVMAGVVPESVRDELPTSWEHRLVMWDFVTAAIGEHPLLGHGFDASRTFDATYMNNDNYEMTIVSLHPHHFGLQIWLETGLIGAVLAVAALVTVSNQALKYLDNRPGAARPVAGLLIGLIIIGSVSYGVWQEWLWAMIILYSALYFVSVFRQIGERLQ